MPKKNQPTEARARGLAERDELIKSNTTLREKLQDAQATRDALALRVMELEEEAQGRDIGSARATQSADIAAALLGAAKSFPGMIAEQNRKFQAETFAAYARAARDLGTLGGFPAIEALSRVCVTEMTVLSRELAESRMATVAGVGAVAPTVSQS